MSQRIRTVIIPLVVELVADAFGDHVTYTTMGVVPDNHPVYDEHEDHLFSPNTVHVAKRHVAAMILLKRAAEAAAKEVSA